MTKLTDTFNPESCEELTGYTFRDVISMYEDYERMAREFETIQNIGEYNRGWEQGRNDTMRAYGIKEENHMNKTKEIEALKEHIKQGEEPEKQGYPTGFMNAINRKILEGIRKEVRNER